MKSLKLLASLFVIILLFSGCEEKGNEPTPTAEAMVAQVNSEPWEADKMEAEFMNGYLAIKGVTLSGHLISLYPTEKVTKPGTYRGDGFYSVIIPGDSTDQNWRSFDATITITRLDQSNRKITGTFSFFANPEPQTGANGTVCITGGMFKDVIFKGGFAKD